MKILFKKKCRLIVLSFAIYWNLQAQNNISLELTLNSKFTHQTIEHFGASDAWACQFVGNWGNAPKNEIADLLFSLKKDKKGNPKGIGLSLWRFNIGAGSTEQGEGSGIKNKWRRAECFLDSLGIYNWNKQAGQQWFLKAAKDRNVPYFLGFTNSPPVHFTKNKKSYAYNSITNLDESQNKNFATFLTKVTQGIYKSTGVHFDYLSPVNEPQWKWSEGNQEGTPFSNNEIYKITKALSTELQKAKLKTKIAITEAGQIDYLYSERDNAKCGNQIEYFLNAKSNFYIGNIPQVLPMISGHSYFTTSPQDTLVEKRKLLNQALQTKQNFRYWMSEYCILGNNAGEIEGDGRDLGIKSALYIAKVIHNDLTVANATSWSWWTALSKYNYKDGLIYVDDNETNGNYYSSKMLWAMGNYSRFIRPNYIRIQTSLIQDASHNCMVSAYKDNYSDKIVIVAINPHQETIDIALKTDKKRIKRLETYTTSDSENLKYRKINTTKNAITLAPFSITTILIK